MPGVFKIKNVEDAEFTLTHPDGAGAVSIDSNNIAKTDVVNAALALKANTADLKEIGVGQTWQDMTASRTAGVTYTNSTGKPIHVMLKIAATNYNTYCRATLKVGSMNFFVASNEGLTFANSIVSAIVPNNTTYSYTIEAGYASFFELR